MPDLKTAHAALLCSSEVHVPVHISVACGTDMPHLFKLQHMLIIFERRASLTVTTRSEQSTAPFSRFTAGPLMLAQLGYSQDRCSYLHQPPTAALAANSAARRVAHLPSPRAGAC